MTQQAHRFTSLTAEIDNTSSPLRVYLSQTFPHTRVVTDPHNGTSPQILLPAHPAVNAGSLGTAFDIFINLRHLPHTIPPAARPFARFHPELTDGWIRMLEIAAAEEHAREPAAWALAKAVEAGRSGMLPQAIADLLDSHGGYNEHDLLAIATPEVVEQIDLLAQIAEEHLFPHLGSADPCLPPADAEEAEFRRSILAWAAPASVEGEPVRAFGPTFTASRLCNADADLIQDGILYEFKTTLGRVNSRGQRVDALTRAGVYQLLGYILFDIDDEFGLHTVSLYAARYGRLTSWPIAHLLETLAGRPVDLAEERAKVHRLLSSPHPTS